MLFLYKKNNKELKIFSIPNYFIKNPVRSILSANFIMSPTVIVRKSVLIDVGLFDEALPSCQDWDMWVRIILKGYKIGILKEVLTIYTENSPNSIGLSKNAKKGYRLFLRKHYISIIKYTTLKNWIKMLSTYLVNSL